MLESTIDIKQGIARLSSGSSETEHMSCSLSSLRDSSVTKPDGHQLPVFSACFGNNLLDVSNLRYAKVSAPQMETCGLFLTWQLQVIRQPTFIGSSYNQWHGIYAARTLQI